MSLQYQQLMALRTEPRELRYGSLETALHALGVGFGQDPLNLRELAFVADDALVASPTMASIIGLGSGPISRIGLDFSMTVHRGQRLRIHRPLPAAARIIASGRVSGAWSRGAGPGVLLEVEIDVAEHASGAPLCQVHYLLLARADSMEGAPPDDAPRPHAPPGRPADLVIEAQTRTDQALLYRLGGDLNPLHADPEVARSAGFDRPPLHGLCTLGICCRGVIAQICDYDPSRIRALEARFSSPIYPGEPMSIEYWIDGDVVSFRARSKARNALVLSNGRCQLSGDGAQAA